MTVQTKLNVQASCVDVDTCDEISEGYCSREYTIEIAINGRTLGTVKGWQHVGWIAPGANEDIDGSGLANWGSSQPGGWSVCDGDGQCSGNVQAWDKTDDDHGSTIQVEAETAIGATLEIDPGDVNEWAAALAVIDSLDEYDDAQFEAYSAAVDRCDEIRQSIISAVNAACENCGPEDDGEPDSETIFDDLNESSVQCVRLGNWKGAGRVLAWRDAEGIYSHTIYPDLEDVRSAVVAAADELAADLITESDMLDLLPLSD